jgi:hypothetical protein
MEMVVNLARNLDGTIAIHATATPAFALDQQHHRDAQEDGAPRQQLTLMTTPTPQAHVLRNGYTSLADLKARRQQQPTAIATSSTAPDHLQASHSPQKNTSEDAPHTNISDILIRLCMDSRDERELQIIYDTIAVQAAAPTWTI